MLYRGANTEEKFLEILRNHGPGRTGLRTAVHLHISKLAVKSRQPYHMRIAQHILKDNLELIDSSAFMFHNSDIMLVARHACIDRLEDLVQKIRYFFSGDPLINEEKEGTNKEFATLYDLTRDTKDIATTVERLLTEKIRRVTQKFEGGPDGRALANRLDPARLARLASSLAPTDVSGFLRRQPICRIADDKTPQPVYHELYVRIADLQRVTLPDVEIAGNRWLFLYLTRILDERVLWLLSKFPEEFVQSPLSINFNVLTVLSQKFLNFSNALDRSVRQTVALELQFIDVVADLEAFRFARSFLKEYEYSIIIDGGSHLNLPEIADAEFGADYVKVAWDPRVIAALPEQERTALVAASQKIGPEKLVFSRCSTSEVIEIGRAMNVSLFQGRFVDRLVNPNSRRLN